MGEGGTARAANNAYSTIGQLYVNRRARSTLFCLLFGNKPFLHTTQHNTFSTHCSISKINLTMFFYIACMYLSVCVCVVLCLFSVCGMGVWQGGYGWQDTKTTRMGWGGNRYLKIRPAVRRQAKCHRRPTLRNLVLVRCNSLALTSRARSLRFPGCSSLMAVASLAENDCHVKPKIDGWVLRS